MSAWISDTLCRIATGAGFSVRQLYSDQDETLFSAARPIVLNGITDFVNRPDLADRSIFLTLEAIPEERRRPEKELWTELDAMRPQILGALLDAVSHGLKHLPNTQLDKLPRMADFALWATACEGALWPPGTFKTAYSKNRNDAVDNIIEADPVSVAIRSFMSKRPEWEGTASALLDALGLVVPETTRKSKSWPTSSRGMSGRLRMAATCLRKIGVNVVFERSGHARTRIVRISKAN